MALVLPCYWPLIIGTNYRVKSFILEEYWRNIHKILMSLHGNSKFIFSEPTPTLYRNPANLTITIFVFYRLFIM
jgi:hypothetical protein